MTKCKVYLRQKTWSMRRGKRQCHFLALWDNTWPSFLKSSSLLRKSGTGSSCCTNFFAPKIISRPFTVYKSLRATNWYKPPSSCTRSWSKSRTWSPPAKRKSIEFQTSTSKISWSQSSRSWACSIAWKTFTTRSGGTSFLARQKGLFLGSSPFFVGFVSSMTFWIYIIKEK